MQVNEIDTKNPMSSTKQITAKKKELPRVQKSQSGRTKVNIDGATSDVLKELKAKAEGLMDGVKVTHDAIISHALKKIKDTDIKKIFEASLTDEDRIQIEFEKFNKKHGGKYSKTEWILKLSKRQ